MFFFYRLQREKQFWRSLIHALWPNVFLLSFHFFKFIFCYRCFNSGLTSLGVFSHRTGAPALPKPNFMFTNIQKYLFFLYRLIKYFEMLAEHKSWEICRHLSAMVWMFTTCLSIHHTAHVQPRCTHAFKEYTSEPLTLQLSLIT